MTTNDSQCHSIFGRIFTNLGMYVSVHVMKSWPRMSLRDSRPLIVSLGHESPYHLR